MVSIYFYFWPNNILQNSLLFLLCSLFFSCYIVSFLMSCGFMAINIGWSAFLDYKSPQLEISNISINVKSFIKVRKHRLKSPWNHKLKSSQGLKWGTTWSLWSCPTVVLYIHINKLCHRTIYYEYVDIILWAMHNFHTCNHVSYALY